tara:strand:- start:185 stop:562 length:378 start_codon:yes stop_codon:yes gene_type:complete
MKPKITLLIIGSLMVVQSLAFMFFADSLIEGVLNSGEEAIRVGVLLHNAFAPAFLMIGLMLIFARDFGIESQRKVLLAMIIGYIPLFIVFYNFSSLEIMNISIPAMVPDFLMFSLALFTYLKPKS